MIRSTTTTFDGIQDLHDGRAILAGTPLALRHWFDAQFLGMSLADLAREVEYPALMERATLERAGYFEAFPHGATTVSGNAHALAPAVCYHCYAQFAGARLDAPVTLTCVGKCFRHEDGNFESLARMWEFTMREVVFIGGADWVAERRRAWIERVRAFAASLGLAGAIELATDPFFGDGSRGRKLLQQIKELKYELRAPLALASFNLHETFFTGRFDIRQSDDSPAQTGCVAFGLERWVWAFLNQRGPQAAEELCRDLR